MGGPQEATGISALARHRVVIVDDDELIQRALSRVLRASGFSTSCFRAPGEALLLLPIEAPAVIICDFLLPRMDGLTFLKEARTLVPSAARILCTAAGDSEAVRDAIASGDVCCIIAKPWHYEELIAAVRQAAEMSLLEGQPQASRASRRARDRPAER